jgi:hypothetical protein
MFVHLSIDLFFSSSLFYFFLRPHFLEEPVASKEDMWVVCGFRRWPARPIFSQNNLNCDKNKFERFVQAGAGNFLVASVYGPATFTPAPVLLFRHPNTNSSPDAAASEEGVAVGFSGPTATAVQQQQQQPPCSLAASAAAAAALAVSPQTSLEMTGETQEQIDCERSLQLVCQGTLLSADVDRIVLKRIVLTGYPQRVHKRTAVIKHMFYSREDVKWFKPAPLFTKHGLDGHIMGAVGDHGLLKVHFGRAVQGHDTVCMYLYKRIYPKFVVATSKGVSGASASNGGDGDADVNANDDGSGALALRVL